MALDSTLIVRTEHQQQTTPKSDQAHSGSSPAYIPSVGDGSAWSAARLSWWQVMFPPSLGNRNARRV